MRFETTLYFAPDHPAFSGHFPGAPIVPGAILLDAAVHAVTQALANLAPAGGNAPAPVCQISSVKFLSPVGPGETVTIACSSTPPASVRFDIASGSRKVASGTMVLASAL